MKIWEAAGLALSATLVLFSCVAPRARGSFQVLSAAPAYVLRSPDASDTPFPEVLSRYSEVGQSQGWLLHPNTDLHIENAYYREGAPKHGIADFIGTEKAVYQVRPNGLRLISVESGWAQGQRPADQLPVQELIGAARLQTDPDAVCDGASPHCAAFPEACTVALEIRVVVNGAARSILWGSLLDSVAMHPRKLQLLRLYDGQLTPVRIDVADPNALRLPLLPGDRVEWE